MPEAEMIRIDRDLWTKLQKAVANHDFSIKDLVDLILRDVDLDEYAKQLARRVEFEVESSKDDTKEDERESEEEETSTDEEQAESADDEAENFGNY